MEVMITTAVPNRMTNHREDFCIRILIAFIVCCWFGLFFGC
jgi:hypothetical protein